MTARFAPGTRVRVRLDWPEAGRARVHIRTPHFLRGHVGTVERVYGAFANPEELAFGRTAAPVALYHVAFDQPAFWPGHGRSGDSLAADLYEHWLEPA